MLMRTKGISVIVCGGRDYGNWAVVCDTLDQLASERHVARIVHGGATGADVLAVKWARLRNKEVACYEANWKHYKRAAGPIRNADMLRLEKPQLVVAFPGGAGTADMVRQARAAGVEVYEVGLSAVSPPNRGARE